MWLHHLPLEPPHWGKDETSGLLERVAGENASLPCPARGEAGPWVGQVGEKIHPYSRALGHSLWAVPMGMEGYGVPTSTCHAKHFIPSTTL